MAPDLTVIEPPSLRCPALREALHRLSRGDSTTESCWAAGKRDVEVAAMSSLTYSGMSGSHIGETPIRLQGQRAARLICCPGSSATSLTVTAAVDPDERACAVAFEARARAEYAVLAAVHDPIPGRGGIWLVANHL